MPSKSYLYWYGLYEIGIITLIYIDEVKKVNIPTFLSYTYTIFTRDYIYTGKSMVKEVQGFYCERCRRFMLLAEDMNAHLRSITHYRNFVAEVKSSTLNVPATESKETEQTDVSNYIP